MRSVYLCICTATHSTHHEIQKSERMKGQQEKKNYKD